MNQSLFWKRSVSLARLYQFSTESNSGDDKPLILICFPAYPEIIEQISRRRWLHSGNRNVSEALLGFTTSTNQNCESAMKR